MSGRYAICALALLSLGAAARPPALQPVAPKPLPAADWARQCADDDGWDKPGPPFRIHGNTWYVGTCGITAILVTSDAGHVLIDSGTEQGAAVVLGNVARAGFWIGDVKLLLMSHEHFDHVGGMALLQKRSGAALATSPAAVPVMRSGEPARDDPQYGRLPRFAGVGKVYPVDAGTTALAARTVFRPLPSPGHTPGAMSWSWQSCDKGKCLSIVYADSFNPISADGYRYSDHPEYVAAFRTALIQLADLDCDILITPHPGSSSMRQRILGSGLIDPSGCMRYAKTMTKRLDDRIAQEQAGK